MLTARVDTAAVEAALRRLADGLEDVDTTPVAQRAARAVAGFAPRRSGRLARAVVARPAPEGAEIRVEIVYGGVINYGWPRRNIGARRFVERGTTAVLPDAPSLISGEVQALIDQQGL